MKVLRKIILFHEHSKKKVLGRVALKQKLVIDKLSESIGKDGKRMTAAEAAIAAGYSKSYAESGHLKDTKTLAELLEQELPDSLFVKVHKEGLAATNSKGEPEYFARFKYLDSGYKLKNRYEHTVTLKGKLSGLSDEEIADRISSILSGVISSLPGAAQESDS